MKTWNSKDLYIIIKFIKIMNFKIKIKTTQSLPK